MERADCRRDPDAEEDAEEGRADHEHDDAGCPREGDDRLQRVGGELGDLALSVAPSKGGRLVREGRLEDGEWHREDEDDGEERRERAPYSDGPRRRLTTTWNA